MYKISRQLIEVVLDLVTQREPVVDARQLMNSATESAKSLSRHRLLGSLNAFTDHDLFLSIGENDLGCQSMLCRPRPDREFLQESRFSQSGRSVPESSHQPGRAQNFIDAMTATLCQQAPQTRATIQRCG